MMEIVVHPDPILNQPSRLITDAELSMGLVNLGQPGVASALSLSQLVEEMTFAMRRQRGAGISAIQVGVPLRLFLFELPKAMPIVFINPVLSEFGRPIEVMEGCLSYPGIKINVRRPATVKIVAKNLQGVTFDTDAKDLLARVVLHEYDHLDGRSFITRGNVNLNRRNLRVMEDLEHNYKIWKSRLPKLVATEMPATPKQVYGG